MAEAAQEEADEPTLVPMKRTAAENKAREKNMNKPLAGGSEDYPYGLTITLGKDELDKLGVKALPGVGDTYELTATVKVTSVSKRASTTDESMHLELQITHMALEAGEEANPAKPAAAASLLGR